jgi:hypothetical protein
MYEGFVAIGVAANNEIFLAAIDRDIRVELRNYDPAYFGNEHVQEDDEGRKYTLITKDLIGESHRI